MSDIIFKTLLVKGENGGNIKDIKKTSTNGLVDTYTVTLTNGDTTTFKVTNGKSITSIKKTGSTDLVDTYTIAYNDGTTSTFTVTNGEGMQNLQIGGVNLFTGTRDFSGSWIAKDEWTESGEKYNGLTVLKNNGQWGGITREYAVKVGETYTFSAYIKKLDNSDGNANFYITNTAVVDPSVAVIPVDSEWKRYSITFKIKTEGIIRPRVEFDRNSANAIAICGIKLERHGIPTDWSPAPEDQERYKIATFTTKKEHFENSLTLNSRNAFLKLSDIASNINETIPSGYKVALITNATFLFYPSENYYQNNHALEISAGKGYVYVDSIDSSGRQGLIAHMDDATLMYGCNFRFTAILERA